MVNYQMKVLPLLDIQMPAPVVAAAAAAAARTAAPGLFAGFMNALRPALMSGGLSTGFSMLMGEDLPTALLYGAADTLGWFPSFMETEKYTGNWDKKYFKEGEIKLRFEAKFDEEVVENVPSILYHITPTQNANKILSIGLVPKSRSKASYHPDRVYLSKDLEDIENLGEMFYQKTGIKNWTILKIETDIIPGDYLKLYTDPNYKQGYYTLNNIPPQAIEKVKEINL